MIHRKPRFLALLLALMMLLPAGGFAQEEVHPVVRISIQGVGDIYAELYPEYAPITVENFLKLVNSGFYDGLTFHRIIDGFMIQGGDPLGNGTGGTYSKIKGEFSANGVENPLLHERGVLSMARAQSMDSASSQFFIMHDAAAHLDGNYAAFGRVLAGMWVVDRLCQETPVTDNNGTVADGHQPVMESVRVVDRAEAEAAAEKEAQNGQSGGVFTDYVTPITFPVPEGWNLTDEAPQRVTFTHAESGRTFAVIRQNNWDCLPDSTRAAMVAGGITQADLDTDAFRRESLLSIIQADASLFTDETHSGVLLYTVELSTGAMQAVYFVGANDGYVLLFAFNGGRDDPLYGDVLDMLDHMTFREDF